MPECMIVMEIWDINHPRNVVSVFPNGETKQYLHISFVFMYWIVYHIKHFTVMLVTCICTWNCHFNFTQITECMKLVHIFCGRSKPSYFMYNQFWNIFKIFMLKFKIARPGLAIISFCQIVVFFYVGSSPFKFIHW